MNKHLHLSFLVLFAGLSSAAPARGDPADPLAKNSLPELNDGTFQTLLDTILPKKRDLRWQAVPWRASFWDAVLRGAETDRPVLLWAMNGHPLGCT
jgi:hypothetical protein